MTKLPRIPIARPDIQIEEHVNLKEVMHSKWITQGPFVSMAESHLRILTGRKHALCVSSGTTALIVALLAIREKYDNDVYLDNTIGFRKLKLMAVREKYDNDVAAPILTFAAVHNAIKLIGGHVVYQGAEEHSWQVPLQEYEDNPTPITIVAPCYGAAGMTDVAEDVIKNRKTWMIEDAAESFCGFISGRPAGSFGDISCISFYANKIVTAGEGGAVLTDDSDLYLKMKTIVNHGITGNDYVSQMLGLNGRMTDLQASILCAQLVRLPRMLDRRRIIMSAYGREAEGRWVFPVSDPGEQPAPWLFAGIPENRDAVVRRCDKENIEWRPLFPFPEECSLSWAGNPTWETARKLSQSGIVLPLSSALTDWEVERVCEVIRG